MYRSNQCTRTKRPDQPSSKASKVNTKVSRSPRVTLIRLKSSEKRRMDSSFRCAMRILRSSRLILSCRRLLSSSLFFFILLILLISSRCCLRSSCTLNCSFCLRSLSISSCKRCSLHNKNLKNNSNNSNNNNNNNSDNNNNNDHYNKNNIKADEGIHWNWFRNEFKGLKGLELLFFFHFFGFQLPLAHFLFLFFLLRLQQLLRLLLPPLYGLDTQMLGLIKVDLVRSSTI